MCRLFGFRSVIPSQVHRSLVAAENALGVQSHKHPDGWGVAFYVDGAPHVTRSPMTALGDALFHRLSGVVASETVLAHVRQATQGQNNVLNCHPFQYGRWVGAHNGDIPNFTEKREEIRALISPRLARFVLGDTDSELLFFLFLTQVTKLQGPGGSLAAEVPVSRLLDALRATVRLVREVCDDETHRALLTLMFTDGQRMIAVQGGRQLFFSTYKGKCSDRATCPSLSAVCEAPTTTGYVNHLIISSERLQGENVWEPLEEDEMIAVDENMRVFRAHTTRQALPILGVGT